MTETLYFPGLGFGVELNPVAFSIGSIHIYWYGILIALGFAAALLYCFGRIKEFGLNVDRTIDVVIGGVVGGVIGGRLYYVILMWDELYKDDWTKIFRTWEGGMAIYGAVIGALLVAFLIARWRKLPPLVVFDFAASGFLIGQAFGRWGNFVNVEAFGGNTDLPWGMTSDSIARYLSKHAQELENLGMNITVSDPVHPCFLYESVWCLIGFILLALYLKRRHFDGEVFLMYVAWYGIGRSFIEGLRTDSLVIGTLRVSQVLAILSAIAAIAIILVVRSKISRRNDPDYLPLYVDTDACKNFKAEREAEEAKAKERKASRKDDLVRAEELYQRKKLEKAEENRRKKEALKLAREEEYEYDEEDDDENAADEAEASADGEVTEDAAAQPEAADEAQSDEDSTEE